ncbi:chemotaxis protein CheR [Geobacter hydrogenophilus]|uniref:Protein-glutamate O-methyltransferase n=1 Tax=Geobacter hydrogenophilus TaxID=40983 RepID=A0A9W6G437_9BACT|nr:CheR family methyltransferase [Geobacter hydrogenophilus]MBT0892632.1 chemotaxis protein CheR [Geobacter hydrogenophilus]GLI40030.1 protein-glutamate O-methyltransferase [Geobacter hydrogenophilus]
MTHHISRQLLSRFSEFVSCQLGLHFPEKRWRDLERRTIHAARDLGFKKGEACVQWLLSSRVSRAEIEVLASHLTIGETYFFREKGGFDALESRILPELIGSRRGKEQRLRIWSAGCSSGEEAYSIAILLKKMIPDIDEWNVTILATDINPRALAKAAAGIYSDWSFRGVPEWMKERYFTRCPDGRLEVPFAIRKMVTFANLNLVEDAFPSLVNNTNAMDIIFCRNVLMYFGTEQAGQVTGNFHRSLLDGGWLLVSPCEVSSAIFADFDAVAFPGALFYRKDGTGKRPAAFSCPLPSEETLHLEEPSPFIVPVPMEHLPLETGKKTHPSPQPEPSAYEEALALHRQGDYREAAGKLCSFLSGSGATDAPHPLFGKAAALLAQLFADLGDLEEALRWSGEAIAADKLNGELHYLRATIFQEQGAIDDAVASLKRALYLDHTFVLTHFALGNLTLGQGKKREADRHFANALELLSAYRDDDPVPGGDGMTAGRLADIIGSTREAGQRP